MQFLFIGICFLYVIQGVFSAAQTSLDITLLKVTVSYKQVKGYDTNGCPDPNQTARDKYYVTLQYSITNSGVVDFIPPSRFVGWAACYTPAIFKFLHLKILGGKDVISNNAVAIDLETFATCIVDDSDSANSATCIPNTNSMAQQYGPQQKMVIFSKGFYGKSKPVSPDISSILCPEQQRVERSPIYSIREYRYLSWRYWRSYYSWWFNTWWHYMEDEWNIPQSRWFIHRITTNLCTNCSTRVFQ